MKPPISLRKFHRWMGTTEASIYITILSTIALIVSIVR